MNVFRHVTRLVRTELHSAPDPAMVTTPVFAEHACQKDLSRYVAGHMTGAELAGLEEHLLICEQCRDGLDRAALTGLNPDGSGWVWRPPVAILFGPRDGRLHHGTNQAAS